MAKHISFNAKSNDYVDAIPLEVFEKTPKAVWAAIAISYAVNLGAEGDFTRATSSVVNEWLTLHLNGIVPQATPHLLLKYAVDEDEEE